MESTLADVKQLFNVKAIASAVAIDKLQDGQLAIFAEGSTTSIADTTTFAGLPNKIRIVSKLNGQVYYSRETIEKSRIRDVIATPYRAEKINIWKGLIQNCKCIKDVKLIVNIDEESLIMRDGFTWTHRDIAVVVPSEELACACDALNGERDEVMENNVMTKLLVEKVNSLESDFYEAEAQKKDGTVITDLDGFIKTNNAANPAGPKELIYIVLKGKPQPAAPYRDLDVNYLFPRGVRITPAAEVDGKVVSMFGGDYQSSPVVFEEVQELTIELGAGADLRKEEWDNMNHYTKLNYQTQLCDGIADPNLVYQFENGINYNTINLEFTAKKVERNNGSERLFGILFGTSVSAVYTKLKTIFGAV